MTKDSLQGVARAATVLRALAERPRRAGELVADLGVTWTTMHRTLSQLEQETFVERTPEGVYRVGRDLWVLGSAHLVELPLAEAGLHHVRAASEALPGVAFQLCVQSGRYVVPLLAEQRSSDEILKASYGFQFPLHCGSKGQVLLAYAGDEVIRSYVSTPLEAMTPHTITDPDELVRQLEHVRADAFARTIGDVQDDTGSVAAPVHDRDGRVIASLTGITPGRFLNGGPFDEQLTSTVALTARSISADLGWSAGD